MLMPILTLLSLLADADTDDNANTDAYAHADAVLGARDAEADGVLRDVVPLEQTA